MRRLIFEPNYDKLPTSEKRKPVSREYGHAQKSSLTAPAPVLRPGRKTSRYGERGVPKSRHPFPDPWCCKSLMNIGEKPCWIAACWLLEDDQVIRDLHAASSLQPAGGSVHLQRLFEAIIGKWVRENLSAWCGDVVGILLRVIPASQVSLATAAANGSRFYFRWAYCGTMHRALQLSSLSTLNVAGCRLTLPGPNLLFQEDLRLVVSIATHILMIRDVDPIAKEAFSDDC